METWQIRWNELNDQLHVDASSRDPDFVAAFVDRAEGQVVIHRSASTGSELAAWYVARVREAGFGVPRFDQVPVSPAMWRAATQVVADADAALQVLGITVWRMQAKGTGQTIVVSYEDPHGHGIPPFLFNDISRFPSGTSFAVCPVRLKSAHEA